ncbi:MAG: AI-2E family transporter [Gammaproteobacteria bacterium]|nr:AI-2E family transporter [Gammaproteobacteria bacterium]
MVAQDRLYNLIGVFLIGWLLFKLSPILTPFIAAALLAYIGDPLVDKLETYRIRRTLAVVIVFFGLTILLILLVLMLGPMIKSQISAFTQKLPSYIEALETGLLPKVAGWLGLSSEGGFGWSQVVSEYGDKLGELGTKLVGTLTKSGANIIGAVFTIALTPILAFYLLRDWDLLVARIGALIPRRYQEKTFLIAKESDQALGSFLRGQMMVMIGLAVIYSIGLSMLGLDNAIAIGVLSGLVSFVPYLGFIVGIFLAGITAFAQGGGLLLLAGVVLVFAVGQAIEGTVLTPKLVGESIGLHPVVVIFAVMAGGQLFGFFGVLLALPAAAVLSVFVRHFYADFIEDDYLDDDDQSDDVQIDDAKSEDISAEDSGVEKSDAQDSLSTYGASAREQSIDDEASRSLYKHDPFDDDFL